MGFVSLKGIVMSKNKLPVLGEKSFEDLKHLNQFHDAG
jgi:hypothetical protein